MILKLQDFIYKKLSNIAGKVVGIYFQVPANSKFPYIYIGDFHSKNKSTKQEIIEEIYFRLIVYSRDKSLKFMNELADDIKKLLYKNDGIIIHYMEEKVSLQNDGITHQVSMSFKAILGGNDGI